MGSVRWTTEVRGETYEELVRNTHAEVHRFFPAEVADKIEASMIDMDISPNERWVSRNADGRVVVEWFDYEARVTIRDGIPS